MRRRSSPTENGGTFNFAVARWLKAVETAYINAAVEAALAGLMAPFFDKLIPEPTDRAKRLALPFGIKWPRIAEAIDWVLRNRILTKDQVIKKLDEATKKQVGDFDIFAATINDQLQSELAESIGKGESREQWAERMAAANLSFLGQAEAIGRTAMHRSYNAGTQAVLRDEVIGELFPYWHYRSTSDSRTRETHRALDGKVAFRGSPLSLEMEARADEWGCRCTLVPIGRDEAVALGIDDDRGWVEPEADEADAPTMDSGLRPVEFEPHPHAEEGAVVVSVPTDILDKLWSTSTEYLAPTNKGISDRRDRFAEFLGTGKPVQAPLAGIDVRGELAILDGRHRAAVLRDMGYAEIPVTVEPQDVERFRELLKRESGKQNDETSGQPKREATADLYDGAFDVAPSDLKFTEHDQRHVDDLRELFPEGDGYPTIVVRVNDDGDKEIIDGHNRAVLAEERGDQLQAVAVSASEYSELTEQGYEQMEIVAGTLMLNGQTDAADGLIDRMSLDRSRCDDAEYALKELRGLA